MFFFSKRCKVVKTQHCSRQLSIKTISKTAATVVGLAAIVYILNCYWSKKGSGLIVPFGIFRKSVDLLCFFSNDAKVTKSKAIGDQSTFLVASACEPLDLRKACIVESAAKSHPDLPVHILLYGHVKSSQNPETFLPSLKAYQNVYITKVDLPEYFVGTPLEPLLTRELLNEIEFPEYLVSDLVKIATLYNHGGVCLSWDVVVASSLQTVSNDFFVKDRRKKVSSAILRLSKSEVGKEVINYVASVVNKNFKMLLKKRDLLGNALREVCGRTFKNNTYCEIPIYDNEYFPSTNANGTTNTSSTSPLYVNIEGIYPPFNSQSRKAKFRSSLRKLCPRTMRLIDKVDYLGQPRFNSSTHKRPQMVYTQRTRLADRHATPHS